MSTRDYSDRSLYGRLLKQARPYWLHIAGVFLLSLLSAPLALLSPVPLKIAVDNVLGGAPFPDFVSAWLPASAAANALLLAVALVVAIAVLKQLQSLGLSLLRAYTSEKLVLGFRAQLFRHVQRLSSAYHDAKGTSDAIYRIQYDASAIQRISIDGVIPFITAAFTLVGMIYVVARIDGQLALVALTVAPIIILVVRGYRNRLRSEWRSVKRRESAAMAVMQEVLTALRVVKAFGQEEREQGRFVQRSEESVDARLRVIWSEGSYSLLVGMTTALGTAAVLYIGVLHVQTGLLTLGELLIVISYLSQLYEPLKTIGRKVTSLQSAFISAERAFTLLDEAPEVIEKPGALPLARTNGALTLRDVAFSYDGVHPILEDVTFDIPAGARIGIAGETGAGKTTLMNLLTRFYDPTEGAILLDGLDMREYKLADLRNQFAIVLQEPVLFSTSIAENIAYARPGADETAIHAAAKAANAHAFIGHLPDGYATRVGERGMRLSGGERQRIALARAFLKDAPILILDEPTSSVDMKTEASIMDAMERLMQGRTTFMVAHRLTTLKTCDLLLVVEDGRVTSITGTVSDTVERALESGGLRAERVEDSVHV